MRRRRIAIGVVAWGAILIHGASARPAGVFEDAAAEAGFVLLPPRPALLARLAVTDGPAGRASVVTMGGVVTPAAWFLALLEQPFATRNAPDGSAADGFGDLRLAGRVTLHRRPGSRASLLVSVGTGSGTSALFPYASQALELGLGAAWADTVAAAFYWWAGGEGIIVRRAPRGVPDAQRHVDFVRAFAGIGFARGDADARGGVERLEFDGGRWRELWFARLSQMLAPGIAVDVTGQLESGDDAVRITDRVVRVGMRASF